MVGWLVQLFLQFSIVDGIACIPMVCCSSGVGKFLSQYVFKYCRCKFFLLLHLCGGNGLCYLWQFFIHNVFKCGWQSLVWSRQAVLKQLHQLGLTVTLASRSCDAVGRQLL